MTSVRAELGEMRVGPRRLPHLGFLVPVLLAASLTVAAWVSEASLPTLLAVAAFGAMLGAIVVRDLAERRIPNAITYPGIMLFLVASAFSGMSGIAAAVLGVLLAGGLGFIGWRFSRGGLGLGDVKLAMLVGAVLGVGGVLPFLVFGTTIGALQAVAILVAGGNTRSSFAYGPALVGGAVIALLAGGFDTAIG